MAGFKPCLQTVIQMIDVFHAQLLGQQRADPAAAITGTANQNHRLIGRGFHFPQIGQPFFRIEMALPIKGLQFVAIGNHAGILPFRFGANIDDQRILVLLHIQQLFGADAGNFIGS